MPTRTGKLLVFAGAVGLVLSFLICAGLREILAVTRGWHCGYEGPCTVPATWTIVQTRDTFLISLGVLRSVLQIRAGFAIADGFACRRPLLVYLAVALADSALLAMTGEVPGWALMLLAGWPILVYAMTRAPSVRTRIWEPLALPTARLL